MATEYTGIPGTLTLTADLCEDDDAPSAALLHGPVATLLNNDAELAERIDVNDAALDARVLALEDADLDTRLTALEDPPFLVANLTGSGLSDSNKVTPISELAEGTWPIASNDIQVPKAGWYSVSVHCVLTSTNTGNPYSGGVTVAQAGSGGVAFFRGKRWTATAADDFPVSGSCLVKITDPATEKLSLLVQGAGTIALSSTTDGNKIHLAYLGEI